MKKILLSLAVALTAAGASAINRLPLHSNPEISFELAPEQTTTARKAIARAAEEGTMEYEIAGDPYTALGFNGATAGSRYAAAICMSADDATLFAGNKITAISFYTGVTNGSNPQMNNIIDYNIFVTNDLQGESICTKAHKATRTAFKKNTVELDEPIVIEAGKEYYFGVNFAVKTNRDLGIVVDGISRSNNDNGGWVGVYNAGTQSYSWDNISEGYGFNCISATIQGESLPVNGAYISDYNMPAFAEINTPFSIQALVYNNASNEINNFEVTYTIGDAAPVATTVPMETPISYGQEAILTIPNITYPNTGETAVKLNITKVNGEENNVVNNGIESSIVFMKEGAGFKPHVVGEEYTSIWCGYCPMGITNMEKMVENHPDSFYLVAIHGDMGNADPMKASTFNKLLYSVPGFPYAFSNRTYSYYPNGSIDEIEQYYQLLTSSLAPYGVTAEAELNADKSAITVKTDTRFAFDTDNSSDRYQLSYVLVEDKVGPYSQSNYYSGQQGDYGGWEKKGSSVVMLFDNVGRYLDGYPGVKKSIPATITGEAANEYTRTISIPSNVSKVENMSVLVYLVDTTTGVILNAIKVNSNEIKGNTSAISEIETDNNDAPVEYFNLQGVRVANPSNGIFIRRQGTDVKKVVL